MRGEFMDNWWWVIASIVIGGCGLYIAYKRQDWLLGIAIAGFIVGFVRFIQVEKENDQLRKRLEKLE
jgi:hypothetical protein